MRDRRPRIGFVGLGWMGRGMAPNLCRKGYPLTVIAHRRRDAVDDLLAMGAQEAGGVPEVAKASNWEETKA